ncbi:MAG: VOC family protein [Pseudomonadota bacterium]
MEIKELGHIVLYVHDMDVSAHFYGQVLGWKLLGRPARNVALFSSGRTHHELLLIEVGADAPPVATGHRAGLYHFGLKIGTTDDELRAAYRELEAAGVAIQGATDHGFTHSLYIADPDGNEIELYIDVQPELWRTDPAAVLADLRPKRLQLF